MCRGLVGYMVSLGLTWDGASPEASAVLLEIWRFFQICCGERKKKKKKKKKKEEEDVGGVC